MTALAVVANLATREFLGTRMVLIFLFPAIVIVALLAGRGPAILAMVLSLAATLLLRAQAPEVSLTFFERDLVSLGAFTIACVMIVVFADRIRRADARFRVMADSAPVLAWVADLDGLCTWFNAGWLRFTGRTLEQECGNGWITGVHSDDAERVKSVFRASFDERKPFTIEYRLRCDNGEYRWILGHGVPLYEGRGESFSGYIGSCIDVTAQKSAEQQLEAALNGERDARLESERLSQMKDEFLATLSHEIRTPLNAIVGWTHLLRLDRSPEKLSRGIEVIDRNARMQKQIIDDLLDMSRIMAGKVAMEVQRVDLCAVIDSAIASVQPAADAKHIHIARTFDPVVSATSGDPGRLQQVVWNLLTNAVKFTPEGGDVQVSLKRVGSHAELSVRDTGIGIKPSFLPFVFERFRQGDASTTREHGGLGLGLSISRQLTELHGGTIRATSPGVGHGATFTVILPLHTAVTFESEEKSIRDSALSDRPSEAALDTPSLSGLSVIVAEDEADARELVGLHLRAAGADVELTKSAQEALTAVQHRAFDVLISDIGMPQEDGYSLIQKVRALPASQGGTMPAMALTAFARSEDRRRAILAGYQMHLAKPVDPLELITMVAGLVGRRGRVTEGA
jgi:PAS domain S-box-containing protein